MFKILGAILSLIIAIAVIIDLLTIPDGYGTMIVGGDYSFGFGEKVSAGFGLYLLFIAAVFGSIISFIYKKEEPEKSIS
jgi:hypothetical protein